MIKVAPVLHEARTAGLLHTVWLSGQHTEAIDDLIQDFEIAAEIFRPSRSGERATITGLLAWLPKAMIDCYHFVKKIRSSSAERPLVIVHGDTLSTLVSALAGIAAGGEVVHLESGLTSGRILDPFPEELLRRLTFRLTRYAICPNQDASRRMLHYRCNEIVDTHENTLLDCVRYALAKTDTVGERKGGSYFVASIHRAQNIYQTAKLANIVDELIAVSAFGTVYFVLHPATRKRLIRSGLWDSLSACPAIRLESRMPYTKFLSLLAHARAVFSDGGSNQEELSYLGVPAVLFRERTERPDGLGRNVVLRDSFDDLGEFVRSGHIDQLRSCRRLQVEIRPSKTAVDAMCRWSTRAA